MLCAVLLAAAFAFTPQDADLAYSNAAAFVEACTPRDVGTIRGKIAANFILDETSRLGADVRRDAFTAETPAGLRRFTNLTCEFRSGASSNWVVLVSHYDTKTGVNCPGANDGASSSALLIALANALSTNSVPKGNVMLLWTDGEECMRRYGPDDGLWGSKRAAARLKESGRSVRAVVCLDMIGDSDLQISLPVNGTESLAEAALAAARRIGLSGVVRRIPERVTDDHVPFLDAGFPAIDLIDFEYGPGNAYWHTPMDTMEHVSKESLLKTGRLVAELLNDLL